MLALLNKDGLGSVAIVHEALGTIASITIKMKQVVQATGKAALDVGKGDVMPTMGNSFSNPHSGHFNAG